MYTRQEIIVVDLDQVYFVVDEKWTRFHDFIIFFDRLQGAAKRIP